MKRTHYIYSIILMGLFFIMILSVMMNDLLHFYTPPKVLAMEKRNLAGKPVFDIHKLDPYPAAYTSYYEDRIPFRTKLIEYYSAVISMKFFHRSPYPKVVELGKDGWMYFVSEGSIYKGTFSLSAGQIRQIATEIHNRAVYYHNKGIKFYLAVPPVKQEIYPEYLPRNYFRLPGKNITERILDLVRKDTLVKLVDLKTAILKAKKFGTLYYKTDNHWNALGGYFGYRAIIDRMKQDFPSLQPLELSDFNWQTKIVRGKNIAENMSVTEYTHDEEVTPLIKTERARIGKSRGYKPRPIFPYPQEFEMIREVQDPGLPSVVIVRDSYFYGIMPFIIENFSKSVILFDTFTYGIFDDAIQKENPDLVLYMIFEPHLPNLIGIIWW